MTIPFSTNSNMIISKYAVKGLKRIFRKGIDYKKVGTILTGLFLKIINLTYLKMKILNINI